MDWSSTSRDLVDIIFSCPFKKHNIFRERLHQYITDIYPDALIDSYLKQVSEEAGEITFYTSALLALQERHRIKVFRSCIKDLSTFYPDEMMELEKFVEEAEQKSLSYFKSRKERIDKLNRYLRRIDGAINNGRYSLALGLANRCLKEYYRHFLKNTMKNDLYNTASMNQMAIQIYRYILRYFRTNNIPYSATRLLFITIATNALFIAMTSNAYVDKAVAMYARDNVNSIVRFLLRYS
ncbi:MAG: hypothetical protein AAF806_11715 [Bacteroidota bacterium]